MTKILHLVGWETPTNLSVSRKFFQWWINKPKEEKIYEDYVLYITGMNQVYFWDLNMYTANTMHKIDIVKLKKIFLSYEIKYFIPHMYCWQWMLVYRKFLEKIGLLWICESADVMQNVYDKFIMKETFLKQSIPSPSYVFKDQFKNNSFPWVLKHRFGTNSQWVTYIEEESDLPQNINADQYYLKEYIPLGLELRVGVIFFKWKLHVLPYIMYPVPHKIRKKEDKFTYENGVVIGWWTDYEWTFEIPDLNTETKRKINDIALNAHKAFKCNLYSLFDVRVSPDNDVYILEPCLYCSFWSYSPLAKMMRHNQQDIQEVLEDFMLTLRIQNNK